MNVIELQKIFFFFFFGPFNSLSLSTQRKRMKSSANVNVFLRNNRCIHHFYFSKVNPMKSPSALQQETYRLLWCRVFRFFSRFTVRSSKRLTITIFCALTNRRILRSLFTAATVWLINFVLYFGSTKNCWHTFCSFGQLDEDQHNVLMRGLMMTVARSPQSPDCANFVPSLSPFNSSRTGSAFGM